MNLTRYQVDWCAHGIRKAIALSRLTPSRVEPELVTLLQELEDLLEFTCDGESESDSAGEELKAENLINSAEAAEILDCTPQWVRQIRADLDGRRCVCGAGWVFDEQTVVNYARERRRQ